MSTLTPEQALEKNEGLTKVLYALYLAGFLFGMIPSIIAVIINHMKADDVKGTLLESHFRYQMRTFYYGLLWGICSLILTFVGIGVILLFVNTFWMLYRFIKGFLRLNDGKEMYVS